ncbi:YdcH family protein [Pseudocolwellia sp. HL-MZ19]|uniref:YdcH family protein n=1 Tax=Pseudocolwellia sp. HL-MZ19 TaxID=3400846 RepID=UPI003CF2C48E
MKLQKHDLHHEFPEYSEEIHHLKMTDNHFAKLFKEYHEINNVVLKIEQGVENTSDDFLEQQKIKRLSLKDALFTLIKKEQASA